MKRPSDRKAFSLMEMLVVIAIISALAVAVIPNIAESFNASLTQGGLSLNGTIQIARQAAIAQNQAMEIRLYQYADPTFPGEVAGSPNTGKFRAFQVYQIIDSGSPIPLDMIQHLPQGIIIDSGVQLSSIISPSQLKAWTSNDPQVSLPEIGTSYNCIAFRFHADGSTNLAATLPSPPGSWCLTLHLNNLGDNLSSPPSNFITLQIDPISGKATCFYP